MKTNIKEYIAAIISDNRIELEAKAAKEVVDYINANYNYKLEAE